MSTKSESTELLYHLPLTYARVVGSRRESHDRLIGASEVQRESVVTTEVGADLDTRCVLRMTVAGNVTATSTWSLTADGRLAGADVDTKVDRYAQWAPFLKVGLAGATLALPFLLPGPAGATAALIATLGAGRQLLHPALGPADAEVEGPPPDPDDLRLQRYKQERPHDHEVLLGLRAAVRAQELSFVQAASSGEGVSLTRRGMRLDRLRAELARGETRYTAWLDGFVERTTEPYDERVALHQLPTTAALKLWAEEGGRSSGRATTDWQLVERMADMVGTAISVDLLERHAEDDQVADVGHLYEPLSSSHAVWWRRPRLAAVTVWTATAAEEEAGEGPDDGGGANQRSGVVRKLTPVESQRLLVAYPGNEARLVLRPSERESSAVTVTFDDTGAITKLTSSLTGAARQRSTDVDALLAGAKDSVAVGMDLRDGMAPPALKDQVEAAEAWTKLHPSPDDPEVTALEKRIADEERKARLRLAQQLGTASSPPILVRVEQA